VEDIQLLKQAAGGKLDVTVGSALDLFGGIIPFEKLIGNL
jgi:phosphoribosylformimino-5-aminoimidazole carboxamide ribotide isomerase